MERHGKRRKQKTVTLRLDEDIVDKFYQQSGVDSISLNSLINHALRRYVEWNKFDDKSAMIPIASNVLKELFDMLDKEQVVRLAKDVGKDAIYNMILFMYGKVDFDTALSWYIQRMKHCSELAEKDNGNHMIIFKHEMGENWSLYHKTVLESIFHDILKEPIKVDITGSTVKLEIKK